MFSITYLNLHSQLCSFECSYFWFTAKHSDLACEILNSDGLTGGKTKTKPNSQIWPFYVCLELYTHLMAGYEMGISMCMKSRQVPQ